MIKKYLVLLFCMFSVYFLYSQEGFQFNTSKKKIKIPIQISNNLVVMPVTINGVKLNFLLDTGVENTILFSLEETDSVQFKSIEKIKIRGLGKGEAVDAYLSRSNVVQVNEYEDKEHDVYLILDQEINFSAQLGVPVHGILGYQFFKNHFVEINAGSKKVYVYKNKEQFSLQKLKRYSEIPISIELEKPYLQTTVKINNKNSDLKLLIDTGASDALWLFENPSLKCPTTYFDDFLGRGFSGDVFGKRSRIEEFQIGDIFISDPTASFPNPESIQGATLVQGRNGTIGAGIMKRFNVLFDYPNNRIYLKKNKLFDEPFNYNMSGMEVQHNGKEYVKEEIALKTNLVDKESSNAKVISFESSHTVKYQFTLKPVFEVSNVRANSPAALVGIKKGDILRKINGSPIYKYKLSTIIEILQSEEGRWISVEYERNKKMFQAKFQLKKIL
jgi:PDZ domain/Aspartyl protease